MIKNIAYFPNQCALNSVPVITALKFGLNRAGIRVVENSMDCDAVLIWSVLWAGRMKANQSVYTHYRQQGKPVIIVEIGALHRGVTWKIAVNHVTAQGYYGHLDHVDWDRPKKLGIELKTSVPSRPDIVIALQHTKSMQLESVDLSDWLATIVQTIKNHTDRPIRVRPHPRCKATVPSGLQLEIPQAVAGTYDSFDMQYDCHAVVNYNSGPGIQAAIAGVRPLVDVSSLAHPVSVKFADIEQPYQKDRNMWLAQICHTEYTIQELQTGLWLKRIESVL